MWGMNVSRLIFEDQAFAWKVTVNEILPWSSFAVNLVIKIFNKI